jgi:hypothetical protein
MLFGLIYAAPLMMIEVKTDDSVRSKVLTAVIIRTAAFRDVKPCSLVHSYYQMSWLSCHLGLLEVRSCLHWTDWSCQWDKGQGAPQAYPDASLLLTSLLSCLAFFGISESGISHSDYHIQLMFSSLNTFLINNRVSVTLFPRFAQNLIHTHCQIHHKITSGQMHDPNKTMQKNLHFHPAAWNFVHWFQWYASIFFYHYTALLLLLYTWQHQSHKLWIGMVYHWWRLVGNTFLHILILHPLSFSFLLSHLFLSIFQSLLCWIFILQKRQ